jgi:hypothetical protein
MDREQLLARVFDQLEDDIKDRDFTAIEELLKSVSNETLRAYLPEADPFI